MENTIHTATKGLINKHYLIEHMDIMEAILVSHELALKHNVPMHTEYKENPGIIINPLSHIEN